MAEFIVIDPYLFEQELRRDFEDFNKRHGDNFKLDLIMDLASDPNYPLEFFAYDGNPLNGWCLVGLEHDLLTGESFVLGWLAYSRKRGSLLGRVYSDLEKLARAAGADYVEIRTKLDKMGTNCLHKGYCKSESIYRKRISKHG